MLLYFDESGDTGLKLDSGSSAYFTLVAVRFANVAAASACEEMVGNVCEEKKLKEGFVFHFTDTPHELREYFLQRISYCDFSIFAIVIDKRRILHCGWNKKLVFYQKVCNLLLEDMREDLCESVLVFDRVGGNDISNKLRKHLRERFNDAAKTRIKRFEGGRQASQYRLLQVADMICGSIARRYRDDDRGYYQLIEKRVELARIWP